MPTGTLAPAAVLQVFDSNGDPLPGALLYSYLSGTSTPDSLYHDAGLLTAWTQPAVADSGGFFTSLYMGSHAQKWILKDALGVTLWTVDPVNPVASAVGSGAGLGEVSDFGGDQDSPITATSYPSGATYDKLHADTAVFKEDSTNLSGTYIIRVTGRMDTSGTLTVGIFNLSDGAPDTPLATATATSLTGEEADSGPIAFGASGTQKFYGIKVKVSANTGFANGIKLIRTA